METIKRVIVEICTGPAASTKAVVEPGRTLRVGRTTRADFVVPSDEDMSGTHFELQWDGATCRVKDLGSATGTLLGGAKVEESTIAHGDWIRAGKTNFSVYYEENTPPLAPSVADADAPTRARALAELSSYAEKERLYAVLDAARDPRILTLLRESVEEYRSLFDGMFRELTVEAAPYIVALPAKSRLLARLVDEGWGKSWGVYLTSKRRLEESRKHLRKFLNVTEEGSSKPIYFRYYDPRVMRVFLPMSTPRQNTELYAELDRWLVEAQPPTGLLVFTIKKDGSLAQETIAL